MSAPIVWRLRLASGPERAYEALATDAGREGFWAESSREQNGAIALRFPNGEETVAPVLAAEPPRRFALHYFGAATSFELEPRADGGCDLTLTVTGTPEAEWHEVHAGWVSVLLALKARVDFGVDLRGHDPARTWGRRYCDN